MTYLDVLDIDKYFFFKKFIYWKGRVKMKEEERDIFSLLLLKFLQQPC